MELQLANNIIAMLPNERTVFRYHQDRYAFMLLEYAMKGEISIAQIKASPYAKLLDRPAVKSVLSGCGGGKLSLNDFALAWPIETKSYILTLGLWGWRKSKYRSWYQTSRTGTNLVLQLNFDRSHDAAHQKLLKIYRDADFSYRDHPINKKGRTTLSWARIDLDLDRGEALIEELQNDWIRNAYEELEHVQKSKTLDAKTKEKFQRYVSEHLDPHVKIWSEAILSATLFFLIKEIGIKQIWLHDFETGNRLKKLTWSKPPRSLYTSLPKKFCFTKVNQAPSFLHQGLARKMRRRIDEGKEAFWKIVI